MFNRIKIFGDKGKPIKQSDDGKLELDLNIDDIEVNVNAGTEKHLIYPLPPKAQVEKDILNTEGVYQFEGKSLNPVFMRNHGDSVEIIAQSRNQELFRSIDNGDSWTEVLSNGLLNSIQRVFSTGKSIIAVNRVPGADYPTEIWHSDILDDGSHANWSRVVDEPSAGYFSPLYGASVKDNVVIFSTYGLLNAENPPRFIYISDDYGKNFEEIEVAKIDEMINPATFHIHDVEYDPWSGRIWVSNGDLDSSAIRYSDDWGVNWKTIYTEPKMQPTNIVALPDRVLFSSDELPNGLRVWYRDWEENHKEVTAEDIKFLYTPDSYRDTGGNIINVSRNSRSDINSQIDKYPYDLVLNLNRAGTTYNNPSRLIASPDGERWFEIFKMFDVSGSVVGPVQNDPERKIYYYYYDGQDNRIAILKMPKWVQHKV